LMAWHAFLLLDLRAEQVARARCKPGERGVRLLRACKIQIARAGAPMGNSFGQESDVRESRPKAPPV
jgi:hypothetical protein